MMKVKTQNEIEIMREGGKRLSHILQQVALRVVPGVRDSELDKLARELIEQGGDKPAFLHYKPDFASKPFSATLCVSLNDEVVHGIPNGRVLKDGDIVGLDLGLEHGGLFTDMAVTVAVGNVSEGNSRLMQITKSALEAGITVVKEDAYVGDIGKSIENLVRPAGFSIVEELGGHGVGRAIHESPFIPHFAGKKGERLLAGQTIAIEPMINTGGKDVIFDTVDGYTVRTADGSNSAHYEVTIAVTSKGALILTPIFW
ncbi:MAG TPA: type I methionyl aminopeptidase [Candidatus Paceibacterota bacterium]